MRLGIENVHRNMGDQLEDAGFAPLVARIERGTAFGSTLCIHCHSCRCLMLSGGEIPYSHHWQGRGVRDAHVILLTRTVVPSRRSFTICSHRRWPRFIRRESRRTLPPKSLRGRVWRGLKKKKKLSIGYSRVIPRRLPQPARMGAGSSCDPPAEPCHGLLSRLAWVGLIVFVGQKFLPLRPTPDRCGCICGLPTGTLASKRAAAFLRQIRD